MDIFKRISSKLDQPVRKPVPSMGCMKTRYSTWWITNIPEAWYDTVPDDFKIDGLPKSLIEFRALTRDGREDVYYLSRDEKGHFLTNLAGVLNRQPRTKYDYDEEDLIAWQPTDPQSEYRVRREWSYGPESFITTGTGFKASGSSLYYIRNAEGFENALEYYKDHVRVDHDDLDEPTQYPVIVVFSVSDSGYVECETHVANVFELLKG